MPSSSSSSNPNPLNNNTNNTNHVPYASSPSTLPCGGFPPNTTFVQTDPSNFQAVVQRLTGATQHPSVQKLPVILPARRPPGKPNSGKPFKLHERRQTAKKLEITLNAGGGGGTVGRISSAATRVMMGSPVSPLEMLARRSPTSSPVENEEEEEKGFCFRPSPLSTPRGGRSEPPELLPLFPLHSPSTRHHSSC